MAKSNKEVTITQNFLSGIAVGLSDLLIAQPLWSIQVIIQNGNSANKIFSSIKKNPLVLYSGMTQNAFTTIPLSTLRITINPIIKDYVYSDNNKFNELIKFTAPFFTGASTSLLASPIELMRTIKLKSAVVSPEYSKTSSSFSIFKHYVQKEGILGLFHANHLVALRDGLYTTAFFSGPPVLKKLLGPYLNNDSITSLLSFSLSSIMGSAINHPFDTIKTIQHSLKAENCIIGTNHTASLYDTCKKIYTDSGIKGFYAGYTTRCVRLVTSFIIQSIALETMESYWSQQQNDKNNSVINELSEKEVTGDSSDISDWP